MLATWRDDYNRVRPHSALSNRTPEEFRTHHLALAVTNDTGQHFRPELSPMEERRVSGQNEPTHSHTSNSLLNREIPYFG